MNSLEVLKSIENNIQQAINSRSTIPCTGPNVQIIGVSKTQTIEDIQSFVNVGLNILGENHVQETQKKYEHIKNVNWHLIGHLQTNKAKDAVKLFDLIQSVDSERILLEINKQAKKINKIQNILLQVNISGEQSKFGIKPEEVLPLGNIALQLSNVKLCGMMVIGPLTDDQELIRNTFRKGYELFENLKILSQQCMYLSMGMSDDYMLAIQEGSNMVRIGSKIFGKRVYK